MVPFWFLSVPLLQCTRIAFTGISTRKSRLSTNAIFLQSFTFANCASTIASGGSASRMKISAHLFIVFVLSCWVYPVFAHWIWSETGWLHKLGAIDFAGGAAVHIVGGISALSGSLSVGPRYGRFIQTIHGTWKVREIKGHNAVYIMTGTCILWYGWFSFNGGSLGYRKEFEQSLRAHASSNTLIGGCVGGLAVHCMNIWTNREISRDRNGGDSGKVSQPYEFNSLALGILGGLVAVTPCGPFIPKWAAALTAAFGVWSAKWTSFKLIQLGIDDPVDAFPTHVPAAIVGIISIGFFATKESLLQYGIPTCTSDDLCQYGVFQGGGWALTWDSNHPVPFAIVWSSQVWVFIEVFKYLTSNLEKLHVGVFGNLYRYSKKEEKMGLDLSFYDGYAYPDQPIPELQISTSGVREISRIKIPTSLKQRNGKSVHMSEGNQKSSVDFSKTVLELPQIDLTLGGKYFVRAANANDIESIFTVVNEAYALESDENSEFCFKSLDYYQAQEDIKNAMKLGTKFYVAIDTDTLIIVGVIGVKRVDVKGKKRKMQWK